jgi:hypothetical protein
MTYFFYENTVADHPRFVPIVINAFMAGTAR